MLTHHISLILILTYPSVPQTETGYRSPLETLYLYRLISFASTCKTFLSVLTVHEDTELGRARV